MPGRRHSDPPSPSQRAQLAPFGTGGALGAVTRPGHLPALPGARMPGPVQPNPRGNIGGLLPVISPSPAAFSPSQVGHVAFGRDDSVTMGPGPVAGRPPIAVLEAIAGAIVIVIAGSWLAVAGRAQRRRTR